MLWPLPVCVVSREWVPLTWLISLCVLTCSCLCGLQKVSAPHLVTSFLCHELWPVPISVTSRECVPLAQSISFHILMCPCFCGPQRVSAPCSITFYICPDLFLPLWSLECDCSLVLLLSFCILTLFFFRTSLGSKYPFNGFIYFWCSNMFLFLYISQNVNFSFCFCLLPVFSLCCFSALQLIFSKLCSFYSNVWLLFFPTLSWFH